MRAQWVAPVVLGIAVASGLACVVRTDARVTPGSRASASLAGAHLAPTPDSQRKDSKTLGFVDVRYEYGYSSRGALGLQWSMPLVNFQDQDESGEPASNMLGDWDQAQYSIYSVVAVVVDVYRALVASERTTCGAGAQFAPALLLVPDESWTAVSVYGLCTLHLVDASWFASLAVRGGRYDAHSVLGVASDVAPSVQLSSGARSGRWAFFASYSPGGFVFGQPDESNWKSNVFMFGLTLNTAPFSWARVGAALDREGP